jgi:putative endopeptidase
MRMRLLSAAIISGLAGVLLTSCTTPPAQIVQAPAAQLQPSQPPAPQPPAPAAEIGEFGLDLAAGDTSVKAGDNFYLHASSTWLRNNPIPADRTRWGTFEMLASKSELGVRTLIEGLARQSELSPTERKIGDFYQAFMDEAAIEAAGLTPIETDLKRLAAAKTHAELLRVAADPAVNARMPIATGITLDQKDPNRYIVSISHSGLGLPEREYYLNPAEKFVEIRSKYVAHIGRLLELAGQRDGAAKAKRILALETSIAQLHWPNAERRDRDRTYNRRTRAEVLELLKGYPMKDALEALRLDQQQEFVVRELGAMSKLAALYRDTPLERWREYMTYSCIAASAPLLSKALADESFDFFGRTLNGQPQERERWKRGVGAVNGALGQAVGEIYVKRNFTPAAKTKMLELVENVRRAYGERIDALPWMTAETKAAAREKLAAFRVKVGYPDRWRDYSALEVRPNDALGNARRAGLFEYNRRLARINEPTDRDEWNMTPQTVNAYYNAGFNEIVFPAAILQPPFFDANADAAVNYGGIGGVIGHEMGHGFDDQGAKSDARGVLQAWWKPEDVAAFQKLTGRLADQYGQFEPLPGLKVNGRLTLGENIGDNGGLPVALSAYRLSLQGKPAPVLAGLTGEQRFFLSWAQVWRTQLREQRLRNQVMTDSHSPAEFRVNGTVRNMPQWYEAFDVKPGDKLYLAPEERVTIW